MGETNIVLLISGDMLVLLEERGILESDVQAVIASAESGGAKLYSEDGERFIGKLKSGNFTAYAEYSVTDSGYQLHNAYSHRIGIASER